MDSDGANLLAVYAAGSLCFHRDNEFPGSVFFIYDHSGKSGFRLCILCRHQRSYATPDEAITELARTKMRIP